MYNGINKRFNFIFDTDGGDLHTRVLPGTEISVPLTGAISSVRDMAHILSASVHVGLTGLSASISFEDTLDSTGATVRITATGSAGQSGSFQGTVAANHVSVTTVQHGGRARWTNPGGDFHEVTYVPGTNLPNYTKTFENGTENLELNITALVEEWISAQSTEDPDRENYGLALKIADSFENGSRNRSYYTKKFF